jgi:hypothetical protein
MIRAGSSWCDLAKHPDGRVELVFVAGTHVFCERRFADVRWTVDAGQALLYLRAAADAQGRVCAVGQGHDDGQAWATIEGGAPINLGTTAVPFPVLIFGDALGWVVFVQRTVGDHGRGVAAQVDVIRLTADGVSRLIAMVPIEATSQGLLYLSADGLPITQDRGRGAIPGLALPSPAPSDPTVWVGQSMSAPTLALFDSTTGLIRTLGTSGGQPPHVVESGGSYYVCSYVDGGAWLSIHRRPFAAAQPPPVEPPVTPPVDPPKETPVQLESRHSQLIEAFAAQFGLPGFSKEEGQAWVGKLASTMKARWPNEGWGTKRASNGRPLSNESVARPANGRLWGYDLIIGAGAPGQRLEPRAHPEDITEQVFVDVESRDWLAGGTSNPGTPPVTPPVTPPPAAGFTFPTGVEMPEDVSLSIIDRYLAGIRERDKIRDGRDTVPSRGALMYLQSVVFKELSSWIVRQKRAPQGGEWWAVGDVIAPAAVKYYQDRQGVD